MIAHWFADQAKIGLVNELGEVIVRPVFDDIGPFSSGYAAFKQGDQWGLVDYLGRVVVDPRFDSLLVEGEVETGFPVSRKEKWGYANLLGKVLIPPVFEEAEPFSEGLAATKEVSELPGWVYYTQEGIKKFSDSVGGPSQFSCGRRRLDVIPAVEFVEKGLFGYLDMNGRAVIAPKFLHAARCFSDNRASVKDSSNAYGVIDVNGSWIIGPKYMWVGNFSGHHAIGRVSKNQWDIINVDGKVVRSVSCLSISGPHCGAVKCSWEIGLCGLYSLRGDELIPPVYDDILMWNETGVAIARDYRGACVAINFKNGHTLVESRVDGDLMVFPSSKVVVKRDGNSVIIYDLNGNTIFKA